MLETLPAVTVATLADLVPSRGSTVTSLDLKDKKNRRIALAAQQSCDFRLTEKIGEQIRVCHYVAHPVQIKGATDGEIIEAVRLVLVDKAGKTYETVGATLIGSFMAIASLEGYPPWPDGKKLTVRTKKRGERSIYWFDLED
jgi:hypothetical protein